VGAPFEKQNTSSNAGSAYVFVNTSDDPTSPAWIPLIQFQPDDLTQNNVFGSSVTINNNVAVIGAAHANAAYVFELVSSTWTQKIPNSLDRPEAYLGFQ
jgi:hypothetical protein